MDVEPRREVLTGRRFGIISILIIFNTSKVYWSVTVSV